MKKRILFISFCTALLFAACSPEIKVCTGHVNSLNDSVMVLQIGEYEVSFDVVKARLTNGAVIPGDSVNVDYIGDLRKKQARAILINLIPPKGTVIDNTVDTTKELLTRPANPQ